MFTLNCNGRLLVIDDPVVMGIINCTPDSFYEGSRAGATDDILFRAEVMMNEGAVILDVGGQSTRPGSSKVPAGEELKRVLPAVTALHRRFPEAIISVDTYYAHVAKECVAAGASIINDVSAGTIDEELIPAVASMKVPYVLMHMKGDPQSMQSRAEYKNVTTEVYDFLNFKMDEIRRAGIKDIIIDPGFGFAKTAEHNFQLLAQLAFFQQLKVPLLAGLSRKATIYKTLQIDASDALNGTTVMNTIALMNGTSILRVHDVKEAVQAIMLCAACKKQKSSDQLL